MNDDIQHMLIVLYAYGTLRLSAFVFTIIIKIIVSGHGFMSSIFQGTTAQNVHSSILWVCSMIMPLFETSNDEIYVLNVWKTVHNLNVTMYYIVEVLVYG